MTFTQWQYGEPNNQGIGEHCIQISSVYFNDMPCDTPWLPALCEFNSKSVKNTYKFLINCKKRCLCILVGRCPLLYTRHLSQAPARRIGDVTLVSCATGFVFVDGDWSKTLSCLDAASNIGQWSLDQTELDCQSKGHAFHYCQLLFLRLKNARPISNEFY